IDSRQTLVLAEEGKSKEIPSLARLHVTPDGRLFLVYYVSGSDAGGKSLSENRLMELLPNGSHTAPVRIPLQYPLNSYFTATVRGGSPPSTTLELLGQRAGTASSICYARVRLLP